MQIQTSRRDTDFKRKQPGRYQLQVIHFYSFVLVQYTFTSSKCNPVESIAVLAKAKPMRIRMSDEGRHIDQLCPRSSARQGRIIFCTRIFGGLRAAPTSSSLIHSSHCRCCGCCDEAAGAPSTIATNTSSQKWVRTAKRPCGSWREVKCSYSAAVRICGLCSSAGAIYGIARSDGHTAQWDSFLCR